MLVEAILAGWGPVFEKLRATQRPATGPAGGVRPGEHGSDRPGDADGPGDPGEADGPASSSRSDGRAHSGDEVGGEAPLGCGCGGCASPTICRVCPVCRGAAGWDVVAPQTLASLADAADLLAGGLRAVARRLSEAAQQSGPTSGSHDEGNTP